jgi:hypothetical protein
LHLFFQGVELEFHLLSADQMHKLADPSDTATKPCYSIEPLMKQFDLISELQEAMEILGWEPYQVDIVVDLIAARFSLSAARILEPAASQFRHTKLYLCSIWPPWREKEDHSSLKLRSTGENPHRSGN